MQCFLSFLPSFLAPSLPLLSLPRFFFLFLSFLLTSCVMKLFNIKTFYFYLGKKYILKLSEVTWNTLKSCSTKMKVWILQLINILLTFYFIISLEK